MQRKLAIVLLAASTLTAASQYRYTESPSKKRFEEAARNATIKFEQTQKYKDMQYHIEQEVNNFAVHLSPKKHATATADYLLDQGFHVTQIIMYTATDSAIIIIYVSKRGTKNADVIKEQIRKVLEPWNPEN